MSVLKYFYILSCFKFCLPFSTPPIKGNNHFMFRIGRSNLLKTSLRGGLLAASVDCFGRDKLLKSPIASVCSENEMTGSKNENSDFNDLWDWKTEQGIIKPYLDDRDYRFITLENGLKVILVHDEKADKAAAAMSVSVGASNDPHYIPGLAHFCEHMLFLGTEAYPLENAYKKYLASNGGRSNASTSMDTTTFQFEVGSSHLKGALDIFSNFFIGPLFTESATDREIKAVDSEDSKNRTDDGRRLLQILKDLADPMHPYSKYSTGNFKTLKSNVPANYDTREELLQFYKTHYFAENMGLAILGKESLDDLENWANGLFGKIPSKPLSKENEPKDLDRKVTPFKNLPKYIEFQPLKESRKIIVIWPLPSVKENWKDDPTHLLGHIWGNESPGSLLSVLREKGLANSVSAGLRTSHEDFCLFQVTVGLTDKGVENSDAVLDLVFSFNNIVIDIKDSEIKRIWKDVREMAEMNFRFTPEIPPYSLSTSLSRRIQLYPFSEVISAKKLLQKTPNIEICRHFLNHFGSQNSMIWKIVKSEGAEDLYNNLEKWYNIKYKAMPVEYEKIEKWQEIEFRGKEMHLPLTNEYIPNEFGIKAQNLNADAPTYLNIGMLSPPQLIEGEGFEVEGGQLWHKMDSTFKQPRACINLLMSTPGANDTSAENTTYLNILLAMIQKNLAEITYNASVAGLSWGLSQHSYGVVFSVYGYDQKLEPLLFTVLDHFLNPQKSLTSEDLRRSFTEVKESMVKSLKSFDVARPDDLADYYLSLSLLQGKSTYQARLKAAEESTFESILNAHAMLLEKVHPLCLIHGNIEQSEAQNLYKKVKTTFQEKGIGEMGEDEFPPVLVANLPKGRTVRLRINVENKAEENSAFYAYWQLGKRSEKNAALSMALCALMKEPCFDSLRTKQQLGYIVHSGQKNLGRRGQMRGVSIRVLSKSHSPDEIVKCVDQFLLKFKEILENMREEVFQKHLKSIVDRQLESPKTLGMEFTLLYNEIDSGEYKWDRYVKLAQEVAALTKDEVVSFLCSNLLPSKGTKRMDIHIYGNLHENCQNAWNADENAIDITKDEIEGFREGLDMIETGLVPPVELKKYLKSLNGL